MTRNRMPIRRKSLRNVLDRWANTAQLLVLGSFLTGCDVFGEGSGACVSSQVDFTTFSVIYCHNDFDKKDCEEFDGQEVNGARWAYHEGQTCQDRGLEPGSNEIGGN